jgi:hypothetical protein
MDSGSHAHRYPERLLRRRQDAELPKEIARIPVDPVMYALATAELGHCAAVSHGSTARGRDSHEDSLMRAGGDPARDNKVTIRELLLDLELKVGKRGDIDAHELGELLGTVDGCWQGVALSDELLIDDLRKTVGIVSTPSLDAFASEPEVFLFGHVASPRCLGGCPG